MKNLLIFLVSFHSFTVGFGQQQKVGNWSFFSFEGSRKDEKNTGVSLNNGLELDVFGDTYKNGDWLIGGTFLGQISFELTDSVAVRAKLNGSETNVKEI